MKEVIFNITFNGIDKQIEMLTSELANTTDRKKRLEIIGELYRLEDLKNRKKTHSIKGTDILKAGVGLISILAVLKHEETNIVTSKVWNFATGLLK